MLSQWLPSWGTTKSFPLSARLQKARKSTSPACTWCLHITAVGQEKKRAAPYVFQQHVKKNLLVPHLYCGGLQCLSLQNYTGYWSSKTTLLIRALIKVLLRHLCFSMHLSYLELFRIISRKSSFPWRGFAASGLLQVTHCAHNCPGPDSSQESNLWFGIRNQSYDTTPQESNLWYNSTKLISQELCCTVDMQDLNPQPLLRKVARVHRECSPWQAAESSKLGLHINQSPFNFFSKTVI